MHLPCCKSLSIVTSSRTCGQHAEHTVAKRGMTYATYGCCVTKKNEERNGENVKKRKRR